jgi:hypothetical protein
LCLAISHTVSVVKLPTNKDQHQAVETVPRLEVLLLQHHLLQHRLTTPDMDLADLLLQLQATKLLETKNAALVKLAQQASPVTPELMELQAKVSILPLLFLLLIIYF